jgi:membrane-associated protein
MIPGVDLVTLISIVSIWGVALIVFAETGLLIGFFLPGDSLLFTTGFLISSGVLSVNIHLAVLLIFIAAVVGDSVGYTIGNKTGPRLFSKPDARIFKQKYLQQARAFYEKHGGKTIIFARFIPILRTFAPVVAGASKMNYQRFLQFNIIGGFLWAVLLTYGGFFLGRWFHSMGLEIDQVLLPLIFIIIFLSVLPPIIHLLLSPVERKNVIDGIKNRYVSLVRRISRKKR